MYNIVVIDDDYSARKEQYEKFLSKEYETVNLSFKLIPIEYNQDLLDELRLHSMDIDAFFIDARLDKKDKGWGTEFGDTLKGVLNEIQNIYTKTNIPPIFMVSNHWSELGFLSNVSRQFATFHYPLQPSRYYAQEEVEAINTNAHTRDGSGKLQTASLRDERNFIEKIILQTRSERYNSSSPVDVLMQIAVPDEKKRVYQVLNLKDDDDHYLRAYGVSYQEVNFNGIHIVVVAQAAMGMTEAASAATASMLAFNPRLIAMVGICAGRKDKTQIGDIAIASECFDYSFGKLFPRVFEHRPPHCQIANALKIFVNSVLLNHEERIFTDINDAFHGETLSGRKIHFTPMGSGPWVVDNSCVFEEIQEHISGNCLALDMEAYAVAMAAERLEVPWLIIKSIQDYADGKKTESENVSRAYASFSSAHLLCNKLSQLLEYLKK